jgi:hypothetical protein
LLGACLREMPDRSLRSTRSILGASNRTSRRYSIWSLPETGLRADATDTDRVALTLSNNTQIPTSDLVALCRDVARRRVELVVDGVLRGDL